MAPTSKKKNKLSTCLKTNWLLITTALGVALGLAIGFGLRSYKLSENAVHYVGFPGEILLNLFKLIVIPLVTVTLICGVGSMDKRQMGWIGGTAFFLFAITAIIVVIFGSIVVFFVHPGDPAARAGANAPKHHKIFEKIPPDTVDTFLDLLRSGHVLAAVRRHPLAHGQGGAAADARARGAGPGRLEAGVPGDRVLARRHHLPHRAEDPRGRRLQRRRLHARHAIRADGMRALLGKYLVVSVICQVCVFLMHNLLVLVLAARNPLTMVVSQLRALVLAFATSSSTATLPVNMECIEDNMGVDRNISQVIMPVGATINMNGTAIHIAISSLFIAQLNGADLTVSDYFIVGITSVLSAVGAAGIPSASLFTMVIVLSAIQQPVKDITIIIPVDWILDRFRTVNNTYGDAVTAVIVNRFFGSRRKLQPEYLPDPESGHSRETEVARPCLDQPNRQRHSAADAHPAGEDKNESLASSESGAGHKEESHREEEKPKDTVREDEAPKEQKETEKEKDKEQAEEKEKDKEKEKERPKDEPGQDER